MTPTLVSRASRVTGRPRVNGLAAILSRAMVDHFLPRVMGFGACEYFYRADLGVTLNGTGVSGHADQSGKNVAARNYTQGTAANQPVFSGKGGGADQSYFDFNGTSHNLVTGAFAVAQPVTEFFVQKWDAAFAAPERAHDGRAAGFFLQRFPDSTTVNIFAGANLAGTVAATTAWQYWKLVYNGGSSSISRNGTQASAGAAGANGVDGFTLGAANGAAAEFANQSVSEQFGYSGSFSVAQERRINAYLDGRYALR